MLQNGQSCVILNTTSNSGIRKKLFASYLIIEPSYDWRITMLSYFVNFVTSFATFFPSILQDSSSFSRGEPTVAAP